MPKTLIPSRKDDYLELVQAFPLKKLRNEHEHTSAINASGRLIGLHRKLTAGESQYLDALVVLIRDYERSHHDSLRPHVTGAEVLKHLLAERKMTQRQLASLLGVGESAASMILAGQRDLTKSHISVLSRHFNVGVAAFF